MIGIFVKKDDTVYRLDLYQDENIDITFSQQDINDISKVFTDYSQNFSIPATKVNNQVFQYWYENALDNGFDDSAKLDCYIELDGNFFRNGKIKLENAKVENGICKSYSIGFYGNLVSLKDKFKEEKLIDVTQINNIINFAYTDENVEELITTENDSDIQFPLIASTRVWSYGDGNTTNDIKLQNSGIDFKELFPAVRVKSILQSFEERYNILFTGSFLNSKRFTELFLYLKNSEKIKFDNVTTDVDFLSEQGSIPPNFVIDLTDNTITYLGMDRYDVFVSMDFSISCDANTEWFLYIYKEGVLETYITQKGSFVYPILSDTNAKYSYKFKSSGGTVNSAIISMASERDEDPMIPGSDVFYSGYIELNLFGATVTPINILMPDIKVVDFFGGILKAFNLTCYSEDGYEFIVQPLEEWYDEGFTTDITKYCNVNWDVNKSKQYKSLEFKYDKSESLMNNAFYEVFQRYYGDLKYTDTEKSLVEGEDYKVELPFENLLHNKFSGSRLQVGYCLNKDLRPYVPKPILLYKWGLIDEDVQYYLDEVQYTSYNAFGQEFKDVDDAIYTLNFYLEQSSLLDGVVENTLFKVYYQNYIDDFFFIKTRVLNIDGVFNYNTILTLKLNDKVIIRDKRYKINKLDLNLNKNTFKLELITDL